MDIIKLIISALFAYFLGNIQTSILISRAKHDDIRSHGSGNAGSTNMMRVYGLKFGLLTFLCDSLKAYIAIIAAKWLIPLLPGTTQLYSDACIYAAGLFVVLGHNFPVLFGFRGGKGVATSFAAVWAVFGICMQSWIIPILTSVIGLGLVALTGIVSVGSLAGAATEFAVTLFVYAPQHNSEACLFAFALFLLLFLRHIKNIVRIIHGEEKRIFTIKHKHKGETANKA